MIGEYIHFRYRNYLKYGIGRKGKGSTTSPAEVYREAKETLKNYGISSAPEASLKSLEETLNEFFQFQKEKVSNKETAVSRGDLMKNIDAQVQDAIKEFEIDRFSIDMQNGRVYGKYNENLEVSKTGSGLGAIKGFYETTLKKYINQIQNKLNALNPNDIKKQNFDKKWESLEKDIIALENSIKDYEKQLNKSSKGSFYSYKILGSGVKSLAQRINNLNKELAKFGAATLAQGTLFEIITAAAGNGLENAVAEEINERMRGFERSQSTLLTKNVVGGSLVASANKSYKTKGAFDEGTWTSNHTQGKTDIVINLKDNKTPLRISAKNVNLGGFQDSSMIHLLSGSSVLQLLQYDENFLNHYLNIVPARTGNSSFSTFSYTGRTAIHSLGKAMIMARALTGHTLRLSDNKNYIPWANAFVVLDNSIGKVRCYNMNNILETLSSNLNLAKNIQTGNFDDINAIENKWVGGANVPDKTLANDRIIHMLQDLHKMKLDVRMPVSILNKI